MILTIILSTLLVLSITGNILLAIAISKGIEREKIYNTWILKYRSRTEEIYKELKEIDDKQMFEKDDDVGFVFTALVSVMKEFDEEIK